MTGVATATYNSCVDCGNRQVRWTTITYKYYNTLTWCFSCGDVAMIVWPLRYDLFAGRWRCRLDWELLEYVPAVWLWMLFVRCAKQWRLRFEARDEKHSLFTNRWMFLSIAVHRETKRWEDEGYTSLEKSRQIRCKRCLSCHFLHPVPWTFWKVSRCCHR